MAFKRIVSTILVKDGLVVKSYGYRQWRPAGRLRSALQNLDRWLADEIMVLDVSRKPEIDPKVLAEIRSAGISTPLIYGGGIRTKDDILRLLDAGCDRLVLESLMWEDSERLNDFADLVGTQALIGSLPVTRTADGIRVFSYQDSIFPNCTLTEAILHYEALPVSEILLVDADHEGTAGTGHADTKLLSSELPGKKAFIWFGGLNRVVANELLAQPRTAAVAFGNANFERELNVPITRDLLLKNRQHAVRGARMK